jgi:hypothetical protein
MQPEWGWTDTAFPWKNVLEGDSMNEVEDDLHAEVGKWV